MKKRMVYFTLFTLIILFFSSCQSTKKASIASFGEREKKKEAVRLLSSDMVSYVSEKSFDPSLLEKYLPKEYEIYSEYVISYDEIKNKYLFDISSLFPLLLNPFKTIIEEEVKVLSMNPEEFISLSGSLSGKIKKECEDKLYKKVNEILLQNEELLNEFFSQSQDSFLEIQKAYINLSAVGLEYNIPSPAAISREDIGKCFISYYFSLLEEGEEELRNTKVDSSSLYYVFWEE